MTYASQNAHDFSARADANWQAQQIRLAFYIYRARIREYGWTRTAALAALECRLLAVTLRAQAHDRARAVA